MYAKDFYFGDQLLSEFGFMICTLGTESGTVEYSAGSEITFNTVKRNYGKSYSLAGTSYDTCVSAEFIIAKDPCFYGYNSHITNDEFRDIQRWLNRKEFLPFRLLHRHEPWCDPCFYDVSFNIEKIMFADVLCAIKLTLFSDSPYGYGETISQTFDIDSSNDYLYMDISDEIGYIYPNVEITCKSAGVLKIKNSLFPDETVEVKGCSLNEVITINGEIMSINSSKSSHDISNDFNYTFLKIGNTYEDIKNVYYVGDGGIPCRVKISYKPIIKDSP